MNMKLKMFNEKWRGKQVSFCELLKTTLNFMLEDVALCCNTTTGRYPIAYNIINNSYKEFNKNVYIDAIMRVFEETQSNVGMCIGCKRLKRVLFEEWSENQIKIKNIVWNHFKGCNSRCIYCNDTNRLIRYYEPIEIIKRLDHEGLIADSVNINFGGGEPTLLDNLKDYVEYGTEKKWIQLLNTSGLLNKKYIKSILRKDSKFSVQISVDAGTFETYFKIKGQSGFELVWNTIRDYCDTDGRVFVKYIIFSYNSDKKEIDAFIERCFESRVKNICISGEMSANWEWEQDLPWNYGRKELEATAYMLGKLIEANLAAFLFSSIYSKDKLNYIYNTFITYYLKPWLDGRYICIWGLGTYGQRLYDMLEQYDVEVKWFGDNDIKKQGMIYRKSECLSLEKIKLIAAQKHICIFIAISDYEKVYLQLNTELPDVDLRVLII